MLKMLLVLLIIEAGHIVIKTDYIMTVIQCEPGPGFKCIAIFFCQWKSKSNSMCWLSFFGLFHCLEWQLNQILYADDTALLADKESKLQSSYGVW
jgi:hypothetical protein